MITDRLRTEAGLMDTREKIGYACELLSDAAQVLPSEARSFLQEVVLSIRTGQPMIAHVFRRKEDRL